MYFKKQTARLEDEYISKSDFGNNPPEEYKPMGRKFYMHHTGAEAEPWRSRTPNGDRKAAALPLRAGLSFVFHIDYDNLHDWELDLLCFALHPSAEFRHKIGLGRGLGLGSVHITPVKLEEVDRAARYSVGNPFADTARTRVDQRTALDTTTLDDRVKQKSQAHEARFKHKDATAHTALMTIGERHGFAGKNPTETVLFVPLSTQRMALMGAPDTDPEKWAVEDRSFTWSQINDTRSNPEKLKPIKTRGKIPPLKTFDENVRNGKIVLENQNAVIKSVKSDGTSKTVAILHSKSLDKAGINPKAGDPIYYVEATNSLGKFPAIQGILLQSKPPHIAAANAKPMRAASPTVKRYKGVVETYSQSKGHGVLYPDDSQDDMHDVYAAQLQASGLEGLSEGQNVEYDLATINGRTVATNIELIS